MLKLLILEDQPAVREVISDVIMGLEVSLQMGQASSLKEAREMLSRERWDGLIADLSLGDGQSLELVDELRQRGSQIPVVLVSGFLSPESMEKARQLDIHHILAKPFEPDVLLQHMREVLLPGVEAGTGSGVGEAKSSYHGQKLLPEIFEMDRHLGLLYRMFDEMPEYADLNDTLKASLSLAMEVIRAQQGYIAFYKKEKNQFALKALKGVSSPLLQHSSEEEMPFSDLIEGDQDITESTPERAARHECWPGLSAERYIAIPVLQQGERVGVLCLMDWRAGAKLDTEDRHLLGLLVKRLDTLLDNYATHAALESNMRDTLIALTRTLETRDAYTQNHSAGVSRLAVLIAREMGLDEESIQLIQTGGLMHDIGKVGVPDEILLKPGRYTAEEYDQMKRHPDIGDTILANMEMLKRERQIVRHHHERWDGHGYPDGLKGEQIPLIARVVSVADAIDAMTTYRVYHKPRSIDDCIEQLKLGAGSQFDPQVVPAALAVIDRGEVKVKVASESD